MIKEKYIINPWSIIEKGFLTSNILSSESVFSIGNGKIGQRANFEEEYSGEQSTGNYISGIYFPDKTKVGWWKKGYPEYFAKMVNCPNWNKINIKINGTVLDLNTCEVSFFKRELNMKEGWYKREMTIEMKNGERLKVSSLKFLSVKRKDVGAIKYSIRSLQNDTKISVLPCIDLKVKNSDSNWNESFIETINSQTDKNQSLVHSKIMNTNFEICTFFRTKFHINNTLTSSEYVNSNDDKLIGSKSYFTLNKNYELTIYKYGGYTNNNDVLTKDLKTKAVDHLDVISALGFDELLKENIKEWDNIWLNSDIEISGDSKSQQSIRFNIFQLNQTFNGNDPKLNIGPKGFTGEKYGGVTYWDTEAYCIPFYIGTKHSDVSKNLLTQRYNQLGNAIKNAEKIGLYSGAALYPMVTVNGEECHNEWEITFEEIHRNAAIVQAIKKYVEYSDDFDFIINKGIDILIAIAKFWAQRVSFSKPLNKYVILGVTGPNEYENNVDNNWYTNYSAKWCLEYTRECLNKILSENKKDYNNILNKTNLKTKDIEEWIEIENNISLPYSKELDVFIQNDNFLNKELIPASQIPKNQRPLNQNWSWDKILRSPYVKQADVLQGLYYFEDHFSLKQIKSNFDFYEKYTVHESSLSACIHSILSVRIGELDKAYDYFLRASRLDLDDYNNELNQGLHITSMAGAWMSIVEGFGGVKIKNNFLHINSEIPKKWKKYSFKINFRKRTIQIEVSSSKVDVKLIKGKELEVYINNSKHNLEVIKI
jgi:maltose phosphorylase